jgi:hypothetical protein
MQIASPGAIPDDITRRWEGFLGSVILFDSSQVIVSLEFGILVTQMAHFRIAG